MSLTIGIAGLPPERIVFTPSPLAELSAVLHALAEPGHHSDRHGRLTAIAAALPPDLADRLVEAEFLWRSTRADILLPNAPGDTLAEDLDTLDRLDDETFVHAALEITCSRGYGRRRPQPLSDSADRERVRALASARGPLQSAFADRLLTDPPAVRAWLRRLLEDCEQAFFADVWQQVRVGLAADARHKTQLLARQGLAAALAAVSPAVTLDAARSRILVDKLQDAATSTTDGLTFLPTVFGRPHLIVVHAPGWRPVVHYPVATHGDEEPRALSPETVGRRLDAVAHPVRMRLCRTLARGAHTTGELAFAYDLSAPEVSRHLAVLKKAGLLATRRRGRYVLYELDLPVVARLGTDFLESVLR
ncbi:DUF5937 family protein [Streptomyces sp. NPDC001922]|uniref:DUF5937 family protein n=1 Tax=Streptomyces sp. NPDC001922 TaxID=3364624 RepID=UPI0036CD9EC1